MWEPWDPSTVPGKQLDLFQYLRRGLDNHDAPRIAYAYAFDLSPDDQIDRSGKVVRMTFETRGVTAVVERSSGYDFSVRKDSREWDFLPFDLKELATVEQIVDALAEISTESASHHYLLYFRDISVAIVRVPNPDFIEPEVAPTVAVPADVIDWNICPRTNQPHHLIDPPYPNRYIWQGVVSCDFAKRCEDCHGLYVIDNE